MAFMVPEYYYGKMWHCVDCLHDVCSIPADDFSRKDAETACDGDVELSEEGWWVHLTAPGYMDQSDWHGPFKTEREARKHMLEEEETHPDTGDFIEWDYMDEQAAERIIGDLSFPNHPSNKTTKLMQLGSWR